MRLRRVDARDIVLVVVGVIDEYDDRVDSQLLQGEWSWCSYDGHTLYGVLKIILKNLLPPILECMYIRYNTCYLRSLLK